MSAVQNEIVKTRSVKEVKEFEIFTEKELSANLALNTPYRPDHFSIILLIKGQMNLLHNLVEYSVSNNHLLLLPPKSFYELKAISAGSKMICMLFKESYLLEAGLHLNIGIIIDLLKADIRKSFVLQHDERSTLVCLFKLLLKKNRLKNIAAVDQKVIIHCFSTILYECGSLLTKYNTLYKAKLSRKEELAMRFLEMVAQHFEEERSVTFFAQLLNVTPKHLSETMKDVIGRTAGEIIDQAVIMQAKLLLKNPSLNIGEIASALNFSDQSFFGKFFKNHVGLSPLNFRTSTVERSAI